jgi:hypothetical protein
MAIQKRPQPKVTNPQVAALVEELADKFVNGSPDAKPESSGAAKEKLQAAVPAATPETSSNPNRKGVIKGKREQISLTVPHAILAQLETLAVRRGMTRASLINMAITRLIEREV